MPPLNRKPRLSAFFHFQLLGIPAQKRTCQNLPCSSTRGPLKLNPPSSLSWQQAEVDAAKVPPQAGKKIRAAPFRKLDTSNTSRHGEICTATTCMFQDAAQVCFAAAHSRQHLQFLEPGSGPQKHRSKPWNLIVVHNLHGGHHDPTGNLRCQCTLPKNHICTQRMENRKSTARDLVLCHLLHLFSYRPGHALVLRRSPLQLRQNARTLAYRNAHLMASQRRTQSHPHGLE